MMKKLNRDRYQALVALKNNDVYGWDSGDMEYFLTYGLADSIPTNGGTGCLSKISEKGEDYLEENPEMPPLKLTDRQAEVIFRLLDAETYECAPPFRYSGSAWESLKYTDALEQISGTSEYRLTEVGRQAFEQTEPGRNYLKRMADKEKREEIEANWEKTKDAKISDPGRRLRAQAKYMRKHGLEERAKFLEGEAPRADIETMFSKKFSHICDTIRVEFELNSLEVRNIYVGKWEYKVVREYYDQTLRQTVKNKTWFVAGQGVAQQTTRNNLEIIEELVDNILAAKHVCEILNAEIEAQSNEV